MMRTISKLSTGHRARTNGIPGVAALLLASSLMLAPNLAAAPSQTYFVPIHEADIHETLDLLNPGNTSTTIQTVVSIAVAFPGTVIHYDHTEDGYEANLDSPLSPTTEIWGDGIAANGEAPGYEGSDLLNAGDVIVLKNGVPTAPRGANILFDGGDKFRSSEPVAVTRVAWSGNPGTVLAGAVEVFPTSEWGTSFEAPVGEDVVADNMFELVTASLMAMEDDTVISFDFDGLGGPPDLVVELDQGESFLSPLAEGFPVGNKASSNKPIQVHAITGDIDTKWESRWAVVLPTEIWSDEYYLPVSTRREDTADPTDVFLYNPDPAAAIEVTWQALGGGGTVMVPSRGVTRIAIPNGPGANDTGSHFKSSGGSAGKTFYALAVIDANADTATDPNDDDSNLQNRDYDWGISLVPMNLLSTQALVGFAPGVDPNVCGAGAPFDCPVPGGGPGSPVWVMAADTGISTTTVYIDYDADPTTGALTDSAGNQYDTAISLANLERARVFDPNDNDMTGALLYTLDGTLLALAWGQDPDNSLRVNPYFDAGTVIPGLTAFSMDKSVDRSEALAGDSLVYTLVVTNTSRGQIPALQLTDQLPAHVSYQPGSSLLDGNPFADDGVGTPFPLDEGGIALGALDPGASRTFSFAVVIDAGVPAGEDPLGACEMPQTLLLNEASATAIGITRSDDAQTCVRFEPAIDIRKQAEGPDSRSFPAGADVTFDIVVTNIGNVDLSNVVVSDPLVPACDNAIGFLAAGDSVSYQCTDLAVEMDYTNIAKVTGEFNGQMVMDDDPSSVEIEREPMIDIRKQEEGEDSRRFDRGANVPFLIVVTNTGPVDLVNVMVSDPLVMDCERDIGFLASGDSVSYECTAWDVQEGFTNIAKVTGEYLDQMVMDQDPSTVVIKQPKPEPKIDIRKQEEGEDSREFNKGQHVSFEIVVMNMGTVELQKVYVKDPKTPKCNRYIGTMAPGESVSYHCKAYKVKKSFTNVAWAKGKYGDIWVKDHDPSTVVIKKKPKAKIHIRKQAEGYDKRYVDKGSDVPFEIVVTNKGDMELTHVRVMDPKTPDCNREIGTLAPGESVSYECTAWDVKYSFVNVAYVKAKKGNRWLKDKDPSIVKVKHRHDDDDDGGDDDDDGGDDDDDGGHDDDDDGGDDDDDGDHDD